MISDVARTLSGEEVSIYSFSTRQEMKGNMSR